MLLPRLICSRASVGSRLLNHSGLIVPRMTAASATSVQSGNEDFFNKQSRLNRPLSPYTIYRIQLTSLLSISHRLSGIGLSVAIYGLGISQLFASTNFAHQLDSLAATVPSPLISAFKVLVATGFGFHFANGIRHLFWDMGFGFGLKELYTSGYAVLGITALVLIYSIFNYW